MPTDVHKLQQFFGLASYYRWFIQDFAAVSSLLHALNKKGVSFHWNTQCQYAFERLKNLLSFAPVFLFAGNSTRPMHVTQNKIQVRDLLSTPVK